MKKLLLFALIFILAPQNNTLLNAAVAGQFGQHQEAKEAGIQGPQAQQTPAQEYAVTIHNYLTTKYACPRGKCDVQRKTLLQKGIIRNSRTQLRDSFTSLFNNQDTMQTYEASVILNQTMHSLMGLNDYHFICETIQNHQEAITPIVLQEIFRAITCYVLPWTINQATGNFTFQGNPEIDAFHYNDLRAIIDVLLKKGLAPYFARTIILSNSLLLLSLKKEEVADFNCLIFLGLAYAVDDKNSDDDSNFLAEFRHAQKPVSQEILTQARNVRKDLLAYLIIRSPKTIRSALRSSMFPRLYCLGNQFSTATQPFTSIINLWPSRKRNAQKQTESGIKQLLKRLPDIKEADEGRPLVKACMQTLEDYFINERGIPTEKVDDKQALEKIDRHNNDKLRRGFKKALSYNQVTMQSAQNFWHVRQIIFRLLNSFHDYTFIHATLEKHTARIDESVLQVIFQSVIDHITYYKFDSTSNKLVHNRDQPPVDACHFAAIRDIVALLVEEKNLSSLFVRSIIIHYSFGLSNRLTEEADPLDFLIFLGIAYGCDDYNSKYDKNFLECFRGRTTPITKTILQLQRNFRSGLLLKLIGNKNDQSSKLLSKAIKLQIFPSSYLLKQVALDGKNDLVGIFNQKKTKQLPTHQQGAQQAAKSLPNKIDKEEEREEEQIGLPQTVKALLKMLGTHYAKPTQCPENPNRLLKIHKQKEGSLQASFHTILKYNHLDMQSADKFCESLAVTLTLMKKFEAYDFIFNAIAKCPYPINPTVLNALTLGMYYHITGQIINLHTGKPEATENGITISIARYKQIEAITDLLVLKGVSKHFIRTLLTTSFLISSLDDYAENNVTKNLIFLGLAHGYDVYDEADAQAFIEALNNAGIDRESFDLVRTEREQMLNEMLFIHKTPKQIEKNIQEIIKAEVFSKEYLIKIYEKFKRKSVSDKKLAASELQAGEDDLSALLARLTLDENETKDDEADAAQNAHKKEASQQVHAEKYKVEQAEARNEKKRLKAERRALRAAQAQQEHAAYEKERQETEAAQNTAKAQKAAAKKARRAQKKELEKATVILQAAQQSSPEPIIQATELMQELSLDDGGGDNKSHDEKADSIEEVYVAENAEYTEFMNKLFAMAITKKTHRLFDLLNKHKLSSFQQPLDQDDLLQAINAPLLKRGDRAMHLILFFGGIELALLFAASFPHVDFFIKNEKGTSPADLFLALLKENKAIFLDYQVNIEIPREMQIAELIEMLQEAWFQNQVHPEIIAAIKLVEKFAQRTARFKPRFNRDGNTTIDYSIFDILKEFMQPSRAF